MVQADVRAGEEEGDPRHDDAGAAPAATLLQLPPVERHEDRLQEVATERRQPFWLILFSFSLHFWILVTGLYISTCAASFCLVEARVELLVLNA